eukprot:TRINITY_DN1402_c0_g1_i1.p2 TRINITY_DN1402_c0_g1~~TRINITY_DN1402_c0_g1_i1.p2  ORF type:complete len:157 (+),score=44.52 TRINITY_DN1402_c0_g1_i1:61-531(+)
MSGEPVEKKSEGGFMDGQLDWGDKGGKCWECWVCDPCCSGYCCITWWCCGCLNGPKMWSWALDQECGIVNHCLPMCCCPVCCFVRHNIRTKVGVAAGGPMDGLVADCLLATCCGACTSCQELRGAHILGGQESWDFFGKKEFKGMVEPFKLPPLMK